MHFSESMVHFSVKLEKILETVTKEVGEKKEILKCDIGDHMVAHPYDVRTQKAGAGGTPACQNCIWKTC